MKNRLTQIELYLPDCLPSSSVNSSEFPKFAAWDFLLNKSKRLSDLRFSDFGIGINHYFLDENHHQEIPYAALSAYYNCLELAQERFWIKADPVHCILDRNYGYLSPAEFQSSDFKNLNGIINRFLEQDDLTFWIIDNQNALISSSKSIDYYAPSLLDSIQQPLSFEKITGNDKKYWQKLNAELQLLLQQNKKSEIDPDGLYFMAVESYP